MSVKVYQKLLEVKRKVTYIKKDAKGYNYTYASPSAVFGQLNPVLNEVGLILVTNVIDSKSYEIITGKADKEKREWKFDLNFIFDWVDVESGEKVSIPWSASGCNGEDKGLGSALTYAERYFVLKQFNIPTDSDDPDNFAEKNMLPDEKKEKAAKKEADAIAEIEACADLPSLLMCWGKHKALQTVPAVIAAKDARKKELDVPWQPTQKEMQELSDLIKNSTLDKAGKETATKSVAACKTPAEVAVIRKRLNELQTAA